MSSSSDSDGGNLFGFNNLKRRVTRRTILARKPIKSGGIQLMQQKKKKTGMWGDSSSDEEYAAGEEVVVAKEVVAKAPVSGKVPLVLEDVSTMRSKADSAASIPFTHVDTDDEEEKASSSKPSSKISTAVTSSSSSSSAPVHSASVLHAQPVWGAHIWYPDELKMMIAHHQANETNSAHMHDVKKWREDNPDKMKASKDEWYALPEAVRNSMMTAIRDRQEKEQSKWLKAKRKAEDEKEAADKLQSFKAIPMPKIDPELLIQAVWSKKPEYPVELNTLIADYQLKGQPKEDYADVVKAWKRDNKEKMVAAKHAWDAHSEDQKEEYHETLAARVKSFKAKSSSKPAPEPAPEPEPEPEVPVSYTDIKLPKVDDHLLLQPTWKKHPEYPFELNKTLADYEAHGLNPLIVVREWKAKYSSQMDNAYNDWESYTKLEKEKYLEKLDRFVAGIKKKHGSN